MKLLINNSKIMTINTNRLKRMNGLIRKEATGRPKYFSNLLKVSESTVYRYLNFMKMKGAPIKYNYSKRSYYYEFKGNVGFFYIPEYTPETHNISDILN